MCRCIEPAVLALTALDCSLLTAAAGRLRSRCSCCSRRRCWQVGLLRTAACLWASRQRRLRLLLAEAGCTAGTATALGLQLPRASACNRWLCRAGRIACAAADGLRALRPACCALCAAAAAARITTAWPPITSQVYQRAGAAAACGAVKASFCAIMFRAVPNAPPAAVPSPLPRNCLPAAPPCLLCRRLHD